MKPEPFYWAIPLALYFLSPLHRRYLRWWLRPEKQDEVERDREVRLWQWGAVAALLFAATMRSLQ